MQPQYQQYPPIQPPLKKKPKWPWVLLGVGVFLLLFCGGGLVACTALVGNSANQVAQDQERKANDVKITACSLEQATSDLFPHVTVDLTINNASDDQLSYFVDLFVKDSKGVRLANGTAMITDVRPGQEVKHTETISMTKKVASGTKLVCTIDKVS